MAGQDNTNDWWQGDSLATEDSGYQQRMTDPGYASVVKAIAEGRQAQPSSFVLRTPYGQNLIADVATLNPTYDVADAKSRSQTRAKFTSGTQAQNITSFNTALGHLQTLAQAADALENRKMPAWNSIANFAESASGDPRVANFDVARQAVADELGRAFKGSAPTVHDTEGWEKAINSSQSPAQLRSAIGQAANLLQSRIEAMQASYNAGLGTTNEPLPMINPHAEDALKALQSPDYIAHGYKAVTPLFTGSPPVTPQGPTGGGGDGPTSAAGPAPIAPVPGGSPSAPPPDAVISNGDVEAGAVSPEAERYRQHIGAMIDSGATAEQVRQFIHDSGVDPSKVSGIDEAIAYKRAHPGWSTAVQMTPDNKPLTGLKKIAATVSASPVGSFGIGAGDSATFGLLPKIVAGGNSVVSKLAGDPRDLGDIYGGQLAGNEFKMGLARQAHPWAYLGGEAAGFIGNDAALGRIPGVSRLAGKVPAAIRPALGDAIYGSAYSAGSSDSLSDIPGNIVKGAALGVGGGALGRGAVKGVSAALSPVANDAVQRMTGSGITLTPGQIGEALGGRFGNFLKSAEDKATSIPGIGDMILGARRGGVEDFNRAAINESVLAPINKALPADVGSGHAAIAHAQDMVSEAYDKALTPLRANADEQLGKDISAISGDVRADQRDAFEQVLKKVVRPHLPEGDDAITGIQLQKIKRGLNDRIAKYKNDPNMSDLADNLGDMRDAFLSFAERNDPTNAAAYRSADAANMGLKRIEAAAANTKDGVFSPNQFRQAVARRGYGTTTANLARGQAPFQQLATDASTILPSATPESGTGPRLLMAKAMGVAAPALLGAGGGYLTDGQEGAIAGAALGAGLYSRPGLRLAQRAMAGNRWQVTRTLGDFLRDNAALGGAVGVPLLVNRSPD